MLSSGCATPQQKQDKSGVLEELRFLPAEARLLFEEQGSNSRKGGDPSFVCLARHRL
jgi:hypothetical protein